MGNHAKRSAIAKGLKGRGIGKLYYGNKKVAWTMLGRSWLKELKYKLSYKVGDLVNDCDGLNHIIKSVDSRYRLAVYWDHKGCIVLSVDQFKFEDGRYSCGCLTSPDPALSQEEVESKMKAFLDYWRYPSPYYQKMREAFAAGKHICDERGILLPEFENR